MPSKSSLGDRSDLSAGPARSAPKATRQSRIVTPTDYLSRKPPAPLEESLGDLDRYDHVRDEGPKLQEGVPPLHEYGHDAIQRSLHFAYALLLHPTSLPKLVNLYAPDHADDRTLKAIEHAIRDTFAEDHWVVGVPHKPSTSAKSEDAALAFHARCPHEAASSAWGHALYLREDVFNYLLRQEQRFPDRSDGEDIDLASPDVSQSVKREHAMALFFVGAMLAPELCHALRVQVYSRLSNVPGISLETPQRHFRVTRNKDNGDLTETPEGGIVWESSLFGGELAAVTEPIPMSSLPNEYIRNFDPKMPGRRKSRKRTPSPELAFLSPDERATYWEKKAAALATVNPKTPLHHLAVGKWMGKDFCRFQIPDAWVINAYEAFLNGSFDQVCFPPPVSKQAVDETTCPVLSRTRSPAQRARSCVANLSTATA